MTSQVIRFGLNAIGVEKKVDVILGNVCHMMRIKYEDYLLVG